MPKAKLKFPAASQKQLSVAAEFTNVKLGKAIIVGETIIVECQSIDTQNFLEMDRMRTQVKGNELDVVAAPAVAEKSDKKTVKA
jgi:hypothetical protein